MNTTHEWLQRLVGEWTFEMEATGPDGEPASVRGTESVRALGGVWVVGEGREQRPAGGGPSWLMTLGHLAEGDRFVGTFVGTTMEYLWIYEGRLDAAGRALTLETEGPSFEPGGGMAPYRDTIEIVDDDHRVMTSAYLRAGGEWHRFMTMSYRRSR